MLLGTNLAQLIARVIPAGQQAVFVCTPSQMGSAFADAIVTACNKERLPESSVNPLAVRIMPVGSIAVQEQPTATHPYIFTTVAEGFRDRPLVWVQGDYQPLPGIMNVVAPLIAEGFPGTGSSRATVSDIADAFCNRAKTNSPDRLTPQGWQNLSETSSFILTFLRDALENIGNDGVDWTVAWWRSAAVFLDSLQSRFDSTVSLSSTNLSWVFSAAGLPFPSGGFTEYRRLSSDIYARIVQDRFSSRDAAEETMAWLRVSATPTGLDDLPWCDYPSQLNNEGHPGSAFLMLGNETPSRNQAWGQTSEEGFLCLLALANQGGQINLRIAETPAPIVSASQNVFILPTRDASWTFPTRSECCVTFDGAELIVPWRSGVTPPSTCSVPPRILFRPAAGWLFDQVVPTCSSEGLSLKGCLSFSCKSSGTWPTKPVVVRCDTPGSLVGYLNTDASAKLVMPSPWSPSLFITHGSSSKLFVGSGGKFKIASRAFSPVETDPYELSLKSESDGAVTCYDGRFSSSPSSAPSCELFTIGRVTAVQPVSQFKGLSEIPRLRITNGMEVKDATGEILVSIAVDEDIPHPWLPLAATALGTTPSDGVPTQEMTDRLRGHLETLWVDSLRKLPVIDVNSMIYCILPTATAETLRGTPVQGGAFTKWLTRPDQGFLMEIENAGTGPSPELAGSQELVTFLGALDELVRELERQGNGGRNIWPSRWQLKDLPEALMDRYLDAFSALVARGQQLGPAALFWASYPFSAIIYDANAARVDAILLSPLHPVRLAWLYGAERALVDAGCGRDQRWRTLAQVLEGWNYPFIGPAPGYDELAPLAAIPIDAGPEQLFLGWSALVAFDTSAGSQLLMPSYAGGWRMPGGSSSGLNQGGVGAAIRDFMRVYPHLPTITIELFASSPTPRSVELDTAVMRELAKVAADDTDAVPLPHSLRILDSEYREGPLPERDDAFESFSTAGSELPVFEWRSYPAQQASDIASDLRLVEDAQARVSLARSRGLPLGMTGRWPIRRFVLRESNTQSNDVLMHFNIEISNAHWKSFASALFSMERTPFVTMDALRVRPHSVLLGTSSKARWVVTGNNLVDPSAVARLATQGPTPAMLWEWRPPFLPRRKSDVGLDFGRRPYMTVARIPQPFRHRISTLAGLDTVRADQMLLYLGHRGIGLASLLAMGDNHAEGALGFYLSLRITDMVRNALETSTRKVFVVPLDAVNTLLAAIAGDDDGTSRRADLLLLVADSPSITSQKWKVTLMPIEIKCTGYTQGGVHAPFPHPGSSQVSEKIAQLKETATCIVSVFDSLQQVPGAPDRSLHRAAMMSIVETALLLRPLQPQSEVDTRFESDLIRSILSGDINYSSDAGTLLWFQKTLGPDPIRICDASGSAATCVFLDPAGFDAELWGNESGILQKKLAAAIASKCIVPLVTPTLAQPQTIVPSLPPTPKPPAIDPEPPVFVYHPPLVKPVLTVRESGQPQESIQRPRVHLGSSREHADGIWWDPLSPAGRLTNSHVVILGSAGSGKTQALRSFLLELHRAGVPSLVLDFKDDYVQPDFLSAIGGTLHDATDSLPINPLALPVDIHTGRVNVVGQAYSMCGIFKAVYGLGDIQEAHLREAIFRAYEQAGITRSTRTIESQVKIPQFDTVKSVLDDIGDVSLNNRLAPIFDLGLFQEGKVTVDDILAHTSVLRFTQLPSEEVKKAAGGIVLRAVYNALLKRGHQQGLRLAIIIDEAHRIANLEPVKLLVKEARAYGVGVFLSSQEARDFEDFVFSNAASLLALKLSETSDADRVARLLVGSSGYRAISDELQSLPQFDGFFRNDHYRPFARTTVVPYYERKSMPSSPKA